VAATSPESPKAAVVVLAGGSGTRAGAGLGKVYRPVAGVPLVVHSLWAAARVPTVARLLLVVKADDQALAAQVVAEHTGGLARGLSVEILTGGSTRHGSEWAALCHLAAAIESGAVDVVALHDGARPAADTALFTAVIRTAWRHGGALPTTDADDVLALAPDGHLRPARAAPAAGAGRPPGLHLARVQTPQAFQARPLLAAYRTAAKQAFEGTDSASCVAHYTDLTIRTVRGSPTNLKVTYPHDVPVASRLLQPPS
jgi:2-C-methyl-D-erythritol 4-phosphate cytidylyltransferase